MSEFKFRLPGLAALLVGSLSVQGVQAQLLPPSGSLGGTTTSPSTDSSTSSGSGVTQSCEIPIAGPGEVLEQVCPASLSLLTSISINATSGGTSLDDAGSTSGADDEFADAVSASAVFEGESTSSDDPAEIGGLCDAAMETGDDAIFDDVLGLSAEEGVTAEDGFTFCAAFQAGRGNVRFRVPFHNTRHDVTLFFHNTFGHRTRYYFDCRYEAKVLLGRTYCPISKCYTNRYGWEWRTLRWHLDADNNDKLKYTLAANQLYDKIPPERINSADMKVTAVKLDANGKPAGDVPITSTPDTTAGSVKVTGEKVK